MKLTIENDMTGPLAHKPTAHQLLRVADYSKDLDEVVRNVKAFMPPTVCAYRGGSHVAIHEYWRDEMRPGRLAIITE